MTWTDSLEKSPRVPHGVLFANEVLDNLPVHLAELRDGELREVCVTTSDAGLRFELLPPASSHLADFLERVDVKPREGYRYEIPLAAESFTARVAASIERGCVVLVDYGAAASDLALRQGGTLVCYSASGVDDDPLSGVGQKDITSHANWTSVARTLTGAGLEVAGPLAQREVLRRLGAAELDADLKQDHADALGQGQGAAAVAALSRRQALGVVLDPNGLGGLGVLTGVKGIPSPPFMRLPGEDDGARKGPARRPAP